MNTLIDHNDTEFKAALDRYKYPDRYPNDKWSEAKDTCFETMSKLNARLEGQRYLMGSELKLTDAAIFPFIRQCAFTDRPWFDSLPFSRLQQWLAELLEAPVFKNIMNKYEPWKPEDTPILVTSW